MAQAGILTTRAWRVLAFAAAAAVWAAVAGPAGFAHAAPAGWRVASNRNGIEVAVRANSRGGLPEFRVDAEVAAPWTRVLAVIYDADKHCLWMAGCRKARLLRTDDAMSGLVWLQRATPWPIADRDAVLRTRTTVLEPGRSVRVRFELVTGEGPPPADGVVRMERLEGHWTLERLGPTRTRVVYRADADPALSLPGFLTRAISEDAPRETLLGLRRRTAESEARYAAFEAEWAERLAAP